VELDVLSYEASGGTEHFVSYEDFDRDLLVEFARLRFPNDPVRRELENAAILRELHVYGNQVGLAAETDDAGKDGEDWQHRGYGRRLMETAEDLTREAGYDKLAVIAGVGAREYYREKLGYHQDGPYVSKRF
ncbi:MAG: GNAT family N-acetyltransferase, partial [Halanaeroarchaeum sp.]